ncbi:dipeptide/oligopeptide/nickel ABC transporter permease/ATP-binding protein [Streptomyces sp. NBC_01481]|uniref:dipeptide/oligopeptide/nickel ABC transporter permease/ATP-binding protein n=1 Tax=Streptomyces sp. NBC_01481 TaxID=2975869 RepID=UPI002253D2EE|nr:oligopeptide/dipeptide ABC transporter ATP-binding protein [Streptomyces sp. NBC_01481]MCX4587281.1 ATP-binding cassette domain-containing protein [Streptomyces sp. NBC_01481]
MLGTLVVAAALGPMIWGPPAEHVNPSDVLRGPSPAHPLGTDHLGRDLLARVLAATRLSLLLALAATLLGAVAGIGLGAFTAVVGRRARRRLGALISLLLALPALLVAVFLAVVLGAGPVGAVCALAVASVPGFARLAQTLAAGVAGTDHLAAARVLGLRGHRLLLRHVLPNMAEPLALNVTTAAGAALVALSGLSFLGLGVQAPAYDWGLLLSQGLDRIYVDPVPAVAPGVAIVYAGLTFQLLGEALAARLARRPGGPMPAGTPEESAPAQDVPPVDDEVLRVQNLRIRIPTADGALHPVKDVSLTLGRGEIVGIVGESGSGKSLTAMAIADLLPSQAHATWGTHRFLGDDVAALTQKQRRAQLATGMAVVFQNPASALNPSLRISTQLTEAVRTHLGVSRAEALDRAVEMLRRVSLPCTHRFLGSRPHQLSGGQRQRILIAAALMTDPDLIIADEPTTALDVTVQRHIVGLLSDIRHNAGTAILFVSHDIALVAELCDRVLVMHEGLVVESLPASHLATGARHPYTRALVASVPDLVGDDDVSLPDAEHPPAGAPQSAQGCLYLNRCVLRQDQCLKERPVLSAVAAHHAAACWKPWPGASPEPVREVP